MQKTLSKHQNLPEAQEAQKLAQEQEELQGLSD